MTIKSIRYLKGVIGSDEFLSDGKFQLAFMGRSNVGKSSLINSLVGYKMARSSNYPGRTKRLDIFLVNNQFYFVDLPGYGYAKVPGPQHEKIRKMILWYLLYANIQNRLIVLIIDAYVGLTNYDREKIQILDVHKLPYLLVANKIDKIPKNLKQKSVDQIQKECSSQKVILYSTRTRIGRQELLNKIAEFMDRKD